MKTLLLSALSVSLLMAYTGEVKDGNATIRINDATVTHSEGASLQLEGGDIICFIDGDGRLLLKGEGFKKQMSKRNRSCKQLPPATSDDETDYLKEASRYVASFFEPSAEVESSGVSVRSVNTPKSTHDTLVVKEGMRFIAIKGKTWGPLPVTLAVVDDQGGVIEEYLNDEDVESLFILPVDRVKDGYRLEISNGFGELLTEVTVVIDH